MNSIFFISFIDSIPLWVMITPIISCSVIALAVFIERVIYYNKINHNYRLIITNILDFIRSNNIEDAKNFCKKFSGAIILIIEDRLNNIDSNNNTERLIMESSENAIKKIEKHAGIIATIATIAPMLGLLGTVTGMMKSFSGLSKIGPVAHDLLAMGITEALITTALGLLVAIPSLIFYNYMVSKIDSYIKEVEYVANCMEKIK